MKTYVFFFGGFQSTQVDMNRWLGSAQTQRRDVDFTAYPYLSAGAGANSAVNASKTNRQFDAAVTVIQAFKANKIYIVGHSSGCAIANAVDNAVKDPSIVLVALDGFYPDAAQRQRAGTQLWAAKSLTGKTMHKSLHYDTMQSVGGAKFQDYTARTDCTTQLALHFSLVNADATDAIDTIPKGYTNCRANLDWL